MTLQRNSRRARPRWAGLVGLVMVFSLMGGATALASHPEVSLAGSNFEIDTDANLKVDDPAPSLDWANVNEIRKADEPTGATDDSFGQGTKEDTAVPTVVDGSIPPNKSDLLTFGVYSEEDQRRKVPAPVLDSRAGTDGHDEHGLRVQPEQVRHVETPLGDDGRNGVTPVRTAGDLLIQYDLSHGGTPRSCSSSCRDGTGDSPARRRTRPVLGHGRTSTLQVTRPARSTRSAIPADRAERRAWRHLRPHVR